LFFSYTNTNQQQHILLKYKEKRPRAVQIPHLS